MKEFLFFCFQNAFILSDRVDCCISVYMYTKVRNRVDYIMNLFCMLHIQYIFFDISYRTYFELKARFNQVLDDQKRQVQLIEETITMTKNGYSESLKELEKISEEIHQRRAARQQRCEKNLEKLGVREAGVGAENPPPAVNIESGMHVLYLKYCVEINAKYGKK